MRSETWHPSRTRLMQVKSPSEILATLDRDGKLDGLPFMPEMVKYCGSRLRVHRRAHRTCVVGDGFRKMKDAVFLHDARCDGSRHDQCDRACLLFWKSAWLMPAGTSSVKATGWSAHDALAAETLQRLPTREQGRYLCQSTALKSATTALRRWDIRPYLREIFTGELSLLDFVRIVVRTLLRRVGGDRREDAFKGVPGRKSRGSLNLQPDEWVRIKPIEELRKHLDERGRNCGLGFPATMHHAVGRRYQVAFPVRRIILEQTGTMVELSNTVALKNLLCAGICVANCPRAEYLYCRESWLWRDSAPADAAL